VITAGRRAARFGRGAAWWHCAWLSMHSQGAHMRIRSSRAAGSSEAGGGASGGMLPCKRRGSKGSAARLNSAALAHVHAMAPHAHLGRRRSGGPRRRRGGDATRNIREHPGHVSYCEREQNTAEQTIYQSRHVTHEKKNRRGQKHLRL
jgi:hypothetical protein